MQDFHYNCIKNKHGDKAEMILTDTDTLIYKIKTEDVYEDLYKDKELFNISNYPKDSKYYSCAINLTEGKMENETSGVPIKGFVGLKSKICTFITEDNHESKKILKY